MTLQYKRLDTSLSKSKGCEEAHWSSANYNDLSAVL